MLDNSLQGLNRADPKGVSKRVDPQAFIQDREDCGSLNRADPKGVSKRVLTAVLAKRA